MLVFSVATISTFLMELPTGVLSDMIGRRKTTILGTFAAFTGVFFYAIAGSLSGLIIGSIFDGLSRALHSGNDEALLYDTLIDIDQRDSFAKVLSRAITSFQICGAISAIVGGFVGQWSLKVLIWISLAPLLIRIVMSFWIVEPKRHQPTKKSSLLHLKGAISKVFVNKKLGILMLGSSLLYGMEEACWDFRASFVATIWSLPGVGFSRVLSKLTAAGGAAITGKFIHRFGSIRVLIGGNLIGRSFGLLAVLFPTFYSPVLLGMSSGAYSSNLVAKQVLLQKEFTSEERASMGSIESFLGSCFLSVLSIIIGLIADHFSPAFAIAVLQFAQFPVLGLFWLYERPTQTLTQQQIFPVDVDPTVVKVGS